MGLKPLTIFISSTFPDLEKYREAVHAAVRKLQNHAEDMLYWTADERSATEASISKVIQSDLLILLVAHRYGSIPNGASKSIVELEYEAAREKGVPVLAFFVEPTHPWPPNFIERSAKAQEDLELFRRRVESECVRQFFTTIESLTIATTQAIANFDRRRSSPGENDDVGLRPNQEVIRQRNAVSNYSDIDVVIGEAEDGLPLVLKILRSQEIQKPLNEIAGLLNTTIDSELLLAIGKTLSAEGKLVWQEAGIHNVRMPTGHQERCYVSYNNLTSFFTPSLISRLLAAANHGNVIIPKQTQRHARELSQITMSAPISAREGHDSRLQSSGGENRFLALSLDSEDLYVVGWDYLKRSFFAAQFWRSFVNESIMGFSNWSFELMESHSYETRTVAKGEAPTYFHKLKRILERPRYFENITYTSRVRMRRSVLAEIILMAAKELKKLHDSQCIHGDLKPQNVLLSKDGVALIDSLHLKEGEISPGLSPDWASPEQLLMHPVSKSTDIFPLGLMLCMIVGGELSGEYIQHLIPSEGHDPLFIPVLRDPVLYLSIESKALPLQGRPAWFQFIETCLKYDSSKRPRDADDFVEGLGTLCRDYPLEGSIRFEIGGTLSPELAVFPDGTQKPCRMIVDRWTSLRRTRPSRW